MFAAEAASCLLSAFDVVEPDANSPLAFFENLRSYNKLLQQVFAISESVEEYCLQDRQKAVRSPASCPHCKCARRLEALGYYHRYVTGTVSGTPKIAIRRFRCRSCGKTVSFLPAFAQPYKLIDNQTIEEFFSSNTGNPKVHRWRERLVQYRENFRIWAPRLCVRVQSTIPITAPASLERAWQSFMAWGGSLAEVTIQLTRRFGLTLFGIYRCHLPNPP